MHGSELAEEKKKKLSRRRNSFPRRRSIFHSLSPSHRGVRRSAVTLALLIACPTKVYHYHCRSLFHRIPPLSLSTAHRHSIVVAPQLTRCVQGRWIPFGGRRFRLPPSSPPVDHDPSQLARFPFPSNAHLTS